MEPECLCGCRLSQHVEIALDSGVPLSKTRPGPCHACPDCCGFISSGFTTPEEHAAKLRARSWLGELRLLRIRNAALQTR